MADQMVLTVTLKKDVADVAEGNALAETVKQKLADHPEVSISAMLSNHINLED